MTGPVQSCAHPEARANHVTSSLRWVCTTSAMSARKLSPSGPSIGPAGIARPEILVSRGHCARPPRPGQPWRSAGRTADPHPCGRSAWNLKSSSPSPKPASILEIRGEPVGSHGCDRLVPVRVEQRLRAFRLGPFDIPPHAPVITWIPQQGLVAASALPPVQPCGNGTPDRVSSGVSP